MQFSLTTVTALVVNLIILEYQRSLFSNFHRYEGEAPETKKILNKDRIKGGKPGRVAFLSTYPLHTTPMNIPSNLFGAGPTSSRQFFTSHTLPVISHSFDLFAPVIVYNIPVLILNKL